MIVFFLPDYEAVRYGHTSESSYSHRSRQRGYFS